MDFVTQEHLITRELDDFQHKLGDLVDPEWPVDVRVFLQYTHTQLFAPDFTVGRARQACGLRSNSLRHTFKRCLHLTMRGYVQDRRMLAALRLLSFAEVEVGAVAGRIGYSSPRVFTKAFRRHFRAPPTALRHTLRHEGRRPRRVERSTFRHLVAR